MSVKAKVEAIIYATEDPVTLNQLASLLKHAVLSELRAEEEERLALNETVANLPVAETNEDVALPDDEFAPETIPQAAAPAGSEVPPVDEGASPTSLEPASQQASAHEKQQLQEVKARLNQIIDQLIAEYSSPDRGMEIRQIAGGYRMATKPEHHDVVITFAKSLKPPVRLSLQALETLAVIAYKQPVTVPEISEVRGVDSAGVIATLLDRKLVTTAGRKQVIGRPILYKTTKEFLLRFGLKDVAELPSVEEFEKLGDPQTELFTAPVQQDAAADRSTEDDEPVTEAVGELASDTNRESMPTAPLEGQSADENFEPVTEAVPPLTAEANRERKHETVPETKQETCDEPS